MIPADLNILYEKNGCLALDKPCGLTTQAPFPLDSLEMRVKNYLRLRDHKPGRVYLGIPHRLDRVASGVIVFAEDPRAAQAGAAVRAAAGPQGVLGLRGGSRRTDRGRVERLRP